MSAWTGVYALLVSVEDTTVLAAVHARRKCCMATKADWIDRSGQQHADIYLYIHMQWSHEATPVTVMACTLRKPCPVASDPFTIASENKPARGQCFSQTPVRGTMLPCGPGRALSGAPAERKSRYRSSCLAFQRDLLGTYLCGISEDPDLPWLSLCMSRSAAQINA